MSIWQREALSSVPDIAMTHYVTYRTRSKARRYSTWSGKPISPNNVLRQQIFPACDAPPQASDVAHVQANLLIVGAREWRPRESRRSADGTREGGYDAERLHFNGSLRAAVDKVGSVPPSTKSDPNCSLLFTIRKWARS